MQRVSEAILFFHPAAWYVSRRVSIERELRCDEIVVRMTRATDYAESLLRVCGVDRQQGPPPSLSGAAMAPAREGKAVFMQPHSPNPGRIETLAGAASAIGAGACGIGNRGGGNRPSWFGARFAKATDSVTTSEIALARATVDQELTAIHWEGLDTFAGETWRQQLKQLRKRLQRETPNAKVGRLPAGSPGRPGGM